MARLELTIERSYQTYSHNTHFKITGLVRRFQGEVVLNQDTFSQFSSVTQTCPIFCEPMDCSMPVHRQLLEFTQAHIHRVGDTIQPAHPLLSPSPPAFNLSQHQGLFQ